MPPLSNHTGFAEFILDDPRQIERTIFPIITTNKRLGIKTLVLSKQLEGNKVHVVCIGVRVPEGVLPTAEFARIEDNRDLRALAEGDLQQVELEF